MGSNDRATTDPIPSILPARTPGATRRLACLLGGAIGDALGYRVESQHWREIERRYGPTGIRLAAARGPLVVSDDTQMTLYTLEGMARAASIESIVDEVRVAYLDWLATQGRSAAARAPVGRLAHHAVMCQPQAPGNTCLSALARGGGGTVEQPINDSKGCGGVMRTAPLGFLPLSVDDATVFRLGAECAALTHGHPDGWLPAAAMALLTREALDAAPWDASISRVLVLLRSWPRSDGTAKAIEAAGKAASGAPSRAKVSALGEGWVGEEALAIGLYAAMAARSYAECVEFAANHDGDSDSTASIAGQLWGARHGLWTLPGDCIERLDVLGPLLEVFEAWEADYRELGRWVESGRGGAEESRDLGTWRRHPRRDPLSRGS
jgi:ADP-ribosylglycohydrolase